MTDDNNDTPTCYPIRPRPYLFVGAGELHPASGLLVRRYVEALRLTPTQWLVRIQETVMSPSCTPIYNSQPSVQEATAVLEAETLEVLRAMFFEEPS